PAVPCRSPAPAAWSPVRPYRRRMPGVTNELAVGLPPLNEARRAVWDSYRIEFLPDGYPGKRTDDGVRPHPIHGPYAITDHRQAYGTSHDPHYLEAAKHVADA